MQLSEPVQERHDRQYSFLEITLDGVIHAAGLLCGVAGGAVLIAVAATRGASSEIAAATIYLFGLLAMFGCSAVYNLWRTSRHRSLLQGLDHSAIFLMIAGSYTPFCVLFLPAAGAFGLMTLVWSLAFIGIAMRLWFSALFMKCRVGLYMGLGWVGLLAIGPLIGALDRSTFVFLLAGGFAYSVGVLFHLWTRLPFQNAIWHGFVLAGAGLHFAAVFNGFVIAGENLRVAMNVLI